MSTNPIEEIARFNDARLELAQKAGFNFLRIGIPMDPWIEILSPVDQDKTVRLLRSMVSSASKRKLPFEVALFVPARKIVCEDQYRDRYRAGLNSILAELPDRSDVGIEVINEPPSCPKRAPPARQWAELQEELYQTTRSTRQHIHFVVAGDGWGAADGLLRFDPGRYQDDRNTTFTFHYYEPLLYTHQEVAWLRPDHVNKFVNDLTWPAEIANTDNVRERALAALVDDKSLGDAEHRRDRQTLVQQFDEYPTEGTAAYMSSRFAAVADWARAHNLSPGRILLGEFGVHRHMPAANVVGEPWPTAPAWLAAVRSEAERRHMGWVVWDLDSGFGVICGDRPGTGQLCPAYRTVFAK